VIRVLVVDDSAVVRRILSERLGKAEGIAVVGTAPNPYLARDKIVELRPDVITLDVEMPRMDGLTFLAKLMRYHPVPVIVVSSLTPEGSEAAIKALELGAVEVVSKPGGSYSVGDVAKEIARKIRAAALAKQRKSVSPELPASALELGHASFSTTRKVLAIGASTGGTEAIRKLLCALPASTPGAVIVQHMPERFTSAFAKRLDEQCPMEVREARGGEIIRSGLALIAPGNRHLVVRRSGAQYVAELRDGPAVFYQRPSVEVLFNSVARHVGKSAVGVLLTGMGADGARGLLAMRQAGARTIAQDESTSVVFGMPKAAIELGAAEEVLPLERIAPAVLAALRRRQDQPTRERSAKAAVG
jgi:Chemotaxis response regulator containing a CheY-like receiver domain and a methylesterase domain